MSVLFTGKGTSGSWACRGLQLGFACGGRVAAKANPSQCSYADLIVCVKRINQPWFENVKQSGKPWIWDLVDFYPQPKCSDWSQQKAVEWVRSEILRAMPDGIIWPNKKMQEDVGLDGVTIYHHHRPDIRINPIREKVQNIGYEGSPRYLGRWHDLLVKECERRGWNFLINPDHLADLDIVVAFRDRPHDGYVQRHWKSNVKLANAHGSGTPFVGQKENGYLETASGFELWVESPAMLKFALDELEPYETRLRIHGEFLRSKITLEDCASRLKDYVENI